MVILVSLKYLSQKMIRKRPLLLALSVMHITISDAEHPTFIPMYTPTTLQTPSGHMTRPRTYTIGHKVNSLLSEPSLSTCEIWLLPPTCVLCMPRNQEEGHGTATSIGQDGEDTKYKDQEKKLLEVFSLRMTGTITPEPN